MLKDVAIATVSREFSRTRFSLEGIDTGSGMEKEGSGSLVVGRVLEGWVGEAEESSGAPILTLPSCTPGVLVGEELR